MFARHETFSPRFGWMQKAFAHAHQNPLVFNDPEAPVTIGVGKNMVRSIRFWGWAAKLITAPSASAKISSGAVPTNFGQALLGKDGWDPYLEDAGSWWLLHWKMLSAPCRLPVFWIAFHDFSPVEFEESDLAQTVNSKLELVTDWKQPSSASVQKDIKILFRTYAKPRENRRIGFEEQWDHPFRSLNMLGISPATKKWRFQRGNKPGLSAEVLQYCILEFLKIMQVGGSSISLDRLASEPGSPGKAFGLSVSDIHNILTSGSDQNRAGGGGGGVFIATSPAGSLQLSWEGDPDRLAVQTLNNYFQRNSVDPDSLNSNRTSASTDPSGLNTSSVWGNQPDPESVEEFELSQLISEFSSKDGQPPSKRAKRQNPSTDPVTSSTSETRKSGSEVKPSNEAGSAWSATSPSQTRSEVGVQA